MGHSISSACCFCIYVRETDVDAKSKGIMIPLITPDASTVGIGKIKKTPKFLLNLKRRQIKGMLDAERNQALLSLSLFRMNFIYLRTKRQNFFLLWPEAFIQ